MSRIIDRLKNRGENLILFIMVCVMLLIVCTAHFTSTDSYNLAFEPGERQERGFIDVKTNKPVTESKVRVLPASEYIIKIMLPEGLGNGYTIGFFDPGFHTYIYVEDELIFESGKNAARRIGKEIDTIWHSVPLSNDMSRKQLTIAFVNESDVSKNVDMNSFYIGTESDIRSALTRSSIPGMLIGFICFIVAIFLGIFAGVLYKADYRIYFVQICALTLMTLFIGIYVVSDGSILQLIFANASSRYLCKNLSFIFIPIFAGIYFDSVFKEKTNYFRLINVIYEVAAMLECVLYVTGVFHISYFMFVVRAVLLIELIVVGHVASNEYKNTRNNKALLLEIGFAIAGLLYVIGLIRSRATSKNDASVYMGIGYLIFIGITLVTQVKYMVGQYNDEMKIREFKRMSRIDTLTGGNSSEVAAEWLLDNARDADVGNKFLHMVIKDFSSINVTLGWTSGNEIIKQVYSICKGLLKSGEIVCSMPGASYVMILNPDRNVENLCKELTTFLSMYLNSEFGREVVVAKYSVVDINKGDTLPDLLDKSSIAFTNSNAKYRADCECFYYNEKCREDIKRQYDIETRIAPALANGEFVMYLQPKVNPSNNEVVGAESLVRWVSSFEGMISPGTFIPVAERSNQVRDIDLYMFRKVCHYIVSREESGLKPMKISVNLSKYDIQSENFFDDYERIMDEVGVTGRNIEFEFAESTAFESTDKMERIIDQIHRSGATVAMDDFGSTNSNIAAISRLKFDVIKMDHVFFKNGFPENRHDYILIRDLIKTFHNMAIEVVCEGVETKDQRDALAELMCDQIQGFYYSRPLPEKEFNEYEAIQ